MFKNNKNGPKLDPWVITDFVTSLKDIGYVKIVVFN